MTAALRACKDVAEVNVNMGCPKSFSVRRRAAGDTGRGVGAGSR